MTAVCGALPGDPIQFGQLEFCKIKTGCNRASHQRPVAGAFGSLPRMRGDNGLQHVAGGEIGAEPDAALVSMIDNLQTQRVAA